MHVYMVTEHLTVGSDVVLRVILCNKHLHNSSFTGFCSPFVLLLLVFSCSDHELQLLYFNARMTIRRLLNMSLHQCTVMQLGSVKFLQGKGNAFLEVDNPKLLTNWSLQQLGKCSEGQSTIFPTAIN